jgi:hypothetical protein
VTSSVNISCGPTKHGRPTYVDGYDEALAKTSLAVGFSMRNHQNLFSCINPFLVAVNYK